MRSEPRRGAHRGQTGYRSGYYTRTLVTRVGKLEPRVPQDLRTLLDRALRAPSAFRIGFGGHLAEMYVQRVSSRKVKTITEELCGHAVSASSISTINKGLDASLKVLPNALSASPSLTSSSTRVMRRCAKAESS
jgi:transposase-like protein